MNFIPDPATVDLQSGFSRSPAPDTPGQTGQGIIPPDQTGQDIFQLGRLHLEFSLPGPGPLGKDIQDQLGAVDHFQVGEIGQRADLRRIQVLIENQQGGPKLEGPDGQDCSTGLCP